MKHRLICIGYLGSFECYLDIPKEEAIKRYLEVNEEIGYIRYLDFDDHFEAYNIIDMKEF